MARNPPSVDASVATTRELLNAALARSARRNARVAKLRIGMRWALWAGGQLLKYLLIALAVATPVALGWYVWHVQDPDAASAPARPAAAPVNPAPRPEPAAPAEPARPAAAPRVDEAADTPPAAAPDQPPSAGVTPSSDAPSLRLRLDDSVTPASGAAAAQSPDSPQTPRKTDNP
jgi:hypothetical protein